MPRPPPVTSATRPSRSPMSSSCAGSGSVRDRADSPQRPLVWQPRRVQEGSKKAIIAAFFANLGIAVSKFIGFVITGSASLLAEAIHSLADTGNQGLLMLGAKRALQPADV